MSFCLIVCYLINNLNEFKSKSHNFVFSNQYLEHCPAHDRCSDKFYGLIEAITSVDNFSKTISK